MRYMIIVKATRDTEAGIQPEERTIAAMTAYHDDLARAGVLLDASGVQRSAKGWRIRYDGPRRTVLDGPFAETKELIAGYTLIEVKSREEALEWTRRFPNPAADGRTAEIEVRPLFDLAELDPAGAAAGGTRDRNQR